jgi:hypothetical protein|uniref:Uncharacterized protein n=1 Tax=Siphoviridae sp. ctbQZ1 TaxID=2827581 RepID=A0A8S5LNH0_9CAUD|nr:MAG TPA: hypothetical protein [Siphoviridae sp. ctbQZ1]
MGLIDADALKEYCMNASKSDDDFRRVSLATLANVVDVQPTAYDVDKVVAQLEDRKSLMLETLKISESDIDRGRIYGMDKAIEIVKGGGVDG